MTSTIGAPSGRPLPPAPGAEHGYRVHYHDGSMTGDATPAGSPVEGTGRPMNSIHIDGSFGEGGGQVLRTALSLGIVTGRAVRITNIRAGRRRPGLAPQHLTAVRAAGLLSNARVRGDDPGSTELEFRPTEPRSGTFELEVGTAGAVTLVLQTVLPAALSLGLSTRWLLSGGTDVSWSPTSSYFELIHCWLLRRLGYDVSVRTLSHGFYPRGGGRMEAVTGPDPPGGAVDLSDRGELRAVEVESIAGTELEGSRVAERQLEGFRRELENVTVVRCGYVHARSTGTAVFARARYEHSALGASFLGKRGLPAEKVGTACARLLASRMDRAGALDVHMADQILPYLALRGGIVTAGEISDHTRTNAHVIGLFGRRLDITERLRSYSIQIGFE
jgi:RNA 3'-terminal phosphate cyclase (ATP)